jgi:hypothetical protein
VQAAPDTSLVTARLGAESALKAVCVRFGAALFEQLPCLWQHMVAALEAPPGLDDAPGGDPQALIHCIQVGAQLALSACRQSGVLMMVSGCCRSGSLMLLVQITSMAPVH